MVVKSEIRVSFSKQNSKTIGSTLKCPGAYKPKAEHLVFEMFGFLVSEPLWFWGELKIGLRGVGLRGCFSG